MLWRVAVVSLALGGCHGVSCPIAYHIFQEYPISFEYLNKGADFFTDIISENAKIPFVWNGKVWLFKPLLEYENIAQKVKELNLENTIVEQKWEEYFKTGCFPFNGIESSK
jgi:hypothetical protein